MGIRRGRGDVFNDVQIAPENSLPGDVVIAYVVTSDAFAPNGRRREANARLIAAAPDLYKNAAAVLFACDMDDAFAVDALEGLRRAIEKAEGR